MIHLKQCIIHQAGDVWTEPKDSTSQHPVKLTSLGVEILPDNM